MTASDPEAGAVFQALADDTRREIVQRLVADGHATATELARALPITRQAVAKHLGTLADAGLVTAEHVGREVRYTFRPHPLDEATDWIDEVSGRWERRLARLRDRVERRG